MYKGHPLPNDCPPLDSREPADSMIMYRIFVENELSADEFQSYQELHPDNKRYKNLCVAYAVSMFSSLEFTLAAYLKALKRGKSLGNYIAELIIEPNFGKFELNPLSGHYSFWFYESCIFEEIKCNKIISINGYS